MVALARCSSLLDEITKRCPLRGDELLLRSQHIVSTLFLLLQWQLLRPTFWYTWTDR